MRVDANDRAIALWYGGNGVEEYNPDRPTHAFVRLLRSIDDWHDGEHCRVRYVVPKPVKTKRKARARSRTDLEHFMKEIPEEPEPRTLDDGVFGISGPLSAPQPWFAGRPKMSAGFIRLGNAFYPPRDITSRRRFADIEVVSFVLPGRVTVEATAIYDRRRGRHRWVVITAHRFVGRIRWLERDRELLFGYADSGPVVLDMQTMAVHAFGYRGSLEAYQASDSDIEEICPALPQDGGFHEECVGYRWNGRGIQTYRCDDSGSCADGSFHSTNQLRALVREARE